jgi:tRNA A37 methylthiotransferase MiaB
MMRLDKGRRNEWKRTAPKTAMPAAPEDPALEKISATSRPRICVLTNGCEVSRIEGAYIQEFFQKNGFRLTQSLKEADTVFFIACSLTAATQKHSLEIIKSINSHINAGSELIVCGCLPSIDERLLSTAHQGRTIPAGQYDRLDQFVKTGIAFEEIHANHLIPKTICLGKKSFLKELQTLGFLRISSRLLRRDYRSRLKFPFALVQTGNQRLNLTTPTLFSPVTFSIKISEGCLHSCSYCGVKFSRGNIKSKAIEKIVSEFETGLKEGYREFALLGTDIGAYGRDHQKNLFTLLQELTKAKERYRIELKNLHPQFLIRNLPRVAKTARTGRISRICTAAQSGNDRILSLMNREYRIDDFKKAVRKLKEEAPEMEIETQLMVGFPGETEEEFKDSMKLVDDAAFDLVELYMFSLQPKARAATMPGQIPERIKRKRFIRLFLKTQFGRPAAVSH